MLDEAKKLTGSRGMLSLIDTAKCCHMGSRKNEKDRIVLMLHFVPFHSIKEGNSGTIEPLARSSHAELQRFELSNLYKLLMYPSSSKLKVRREVLD